MQTCVTHCKLGEYEVYIGRPSKWGNPFLIGRDGTREEVITKYENWILHQPHLLRSLGEIQGKVLGCWCSPQPCHGHVLARLADEAEAEAEAKEMFADEVLNEVVQDHYQYGSGD